MSVMIYLAWSDELQVKGHWVIQVIRLCLIIDFPCLQRVTYVTIYPYDGGTVEERRSADDKEA